MRNDTACFAIKPNPHLLVVSMCIHALVLLVAAFVPAILLIKLAAIVVIVASAAMHLRGCYKQASVTALRFVDNGLTIIMGVCSEPTFIEFRSSLPWFGRRQLPGAASSQPIFIEDIYLTRFMVVLCYRNGQASVGGGNPEKRQWWWQSLVLSRANFANVDDFRRFRIALDGLPDTVFSKGAQ